MPRLDHAVLAERVLAGLREVGVNDADAVGVACSGGADSVALVHVLARCGRDIVVLHVDHGSRADAGSDASFVRELASSLGLRCHVSTITVASTRRGFEADARVARYAALERGASELGLAWVATAHTLDDQAETVLLRALRGGDLASILPVRGIVVRPLLGIRREELRSWLVAGGLSWREDPTNADERFERNWARRTVMPLLRDRRPGVDLVLARRAAEALDNALALDELADDIFARADIDDAGVFLRATELDAVPRALRRRVLHRALRAAGSDARVGDVVSVDALRTGAHVRCSGATAWRWDDVVAILREPVRPPDTVPLVPGRVMTSRDWAVRVRVGRGDQPAWTWRTLVPDDAQALVLRARRPGDRVQTCGGTRKVQDVFVDAKVPRPLRDFVPLVATEVAPLAVVGHTTRPGPGALVIDVEPADPTWSRAVTWMRRRDSR